MSILETLTDWGQVAWDWATNNADTIYERVVKNWGYQMFEDSRYQKIVKSKLWKN